MTTLKKCEQCCKIQIYNESGKRHTDRFVTFSAENIGWDDFEHDFCSLQCLRDFIEDWK